MRIHITGLRLLLVDDSEDDVLMARKALEAIGLKHTLDTASDAHEALDYLKCTGKHAGRRAVPPDIILLDISLPLMDGFELLTAIKADPALKRIPVVMLSTSSSSKDISRSYECGAASYITKPGDYEEFKNVMARFGTYWQNVSSLPQ